ncbi:MAG: NFACT RNA binding domain-containing protein [Bacteroidota bacterium]|nr:NFACT RNA binding domain-containing protein [Bacteroidota bacterium]
MHEVCEEIRAKLIGGEFLRAYSIRPGELRMEFDRGEIVAALQPAHTTLYIANTSAREPKRNVMSFFKELEGEVLTSVTIPKTDKIVSMVFGKKLLQLRFYNSPNAILQEDGRLLSSFKKELPPKASAQGTNSENPIQRQLPMLGKWLEAELRSELEKIGTYDLERECASFDNKLRASKEAFFYTTPKGLLLSPIPLQTLKGTPKKYTSISEAIDFIVRTRMKESAYKGKKDSLTEKLRSALARTEKAIADASSGIENSERADRYNAIADAIQSQAHEMQRGSAEFELEISGKKIAASLDPALSPFDNAKRYYEKARRARDMQKELQVKRAKLNNEKAILEDFQQRLETSIQIGEIESLEKEIASHGFVLSHNSEDLTEADPLSKFRQFIVAGGFRVLVGKNAKHNDDLTMHVAKKEDIWLHARHVPGSHVVLQTKNLKQVPKEAIEQAAEIAAFFSDAKTQKHAPVAYTRRKFVRKPKGAAPGAVMVEREEVIMVTPRIPE